MPALCIDYVYTDNNNFSEYDSVVVSNSTGMGGDDALDAILAHCVGAAFVAERVGFETLYGPGFSDATDNGVHFIESVYAVEADPPPNLGIEAVIESFKNASYCGWEVSSDRVVPAELTEDQAQALGLAIRLAMDSSEVSDDEASALSALLDPVTSGAFCLRPSCSLADHVRSLPSFLRARAQGARPD